MPQHETKRNKSVQTHVNLRYNDLVSIALFFRLLRRHRLESDLHHVWLFSVYLLYLVSDFSELASSTEQGRLYSDGPHSPPGLSDIRRASSLTNKHCVGLKEKPPRRCQSKSLGAAKTFQFNVKYTVWAIFGMRMNINEYLNWFRIKKKCFISCLLILHNALPLFWRQVPDMVMLSVFYLKLHLLFSTVFPTLSSGNPGMF